jgi:hypothetical protein
MPIRKRPRPKKKLKIRRKPSEFKQLYNRLQADLDDDSIEDIISEISVKALGYPLTSIEHFVHELMRKLDCEVKTLQINKDRHAFQCCMTWHDYDAEQLYGRYPTKYAVKTSTQMYDAVTITYLQICNQAGKWV